MASPLPFLLDGLRADVDPESWTERVTDPDRWTAITVHALALGIAPLLHERVGPALPERVAARFDAAREAQRERNRLLLVQAGEVLGAAAERGVDPIVLKGVHLAALVYPEPALRPMNDIDLLVTPDELPALESALEALGYEGSRTDPTTGPGVVKHTSTWRRPGSDGATPNPYLSTRADRMVEPHTSLAESWFGLRADVTPGMDERAIAVTIGGHPARVLAPEDLVTHLCVHLTFALIMGAPSAVQLADFTVAPDAVGPDWDVIATRAVNAGAAPALYGALNLASTLVGAAPPGPVLARLGAATPERVRRRVAALDADYVTARTQQPPLRTTRDRVRRGIADRVEAARWAVDRREQARIGMTAVRVGRTDTARRLTGRLMRR